MSDTTIFGYSWEAIQRTQSKTGGLGTPVAPRPTPRSGATQEDLGLLEEHGVEGLRAMAFFGVLDRLQMSGLVAGCPD
jgi:hypothetical protein